MKLVNFRHLKSAVGHEHVNVKKIDLFINYQLTKIIYLKQDLNWPKTALQLSQRTSRRCWSGRSCSSGQWCGDTRNKTWNPL